MQLTAIFKLAFLFFLSEDEGSSGFSLSDRFIFAIVSLVPLYASAKKDVWYAEP